MSLDRHIREEARLIILKALAAQLDGRLNSELIRAELETYGISKARPWVHDELAYMKEMGAIAVVDAGSVKVATLLEKGEQHLKRQVAIEGIRRPSLSGA
jgi:repressor of nif and glnA expression